MAHARQQIRQAFAAAVMGLPLTGANVFVTRIDALEQQSLPAIMIYTEDENSFPEAAGSNRPLRREVQVVVDAALAANVGFDDEIDLIAANIETAISGAAGIWALLKDMHLSATKMSVDGMGEKRMASVRLHFDVVYMTRENESW